MSLSRLAHRAALTVRSRLGAGLLSALSPFDAAVALGVEVRFLSAPTMEGMYSNNPQTIVVSAERPVGRQSFTCAHELGHHVFGHGTCIDELRAESVGRGRSFQEHLADLFAGFLLMPRYAVERAFYLRGYDPATCSPEQMYAVAGQLGVGYSTLIHHMQSVIKLLAKDHARILRRTPPKDIRAHLVGRAMSRDVWQADEYWRDRSLDVQVGDVLLTPQGFELLGSGMIKQDEQEGLSVIEVVAPGSFGVMRPDLPQIKVRVSRQTYQGRACYRHLSE